MHYYICSLATSSPGDDDKFCTEVDAYDMDLCVCLYNMHGHSIFKKLNTAMLVATFLKLCISYILAELCSYVRGYLIVYKIY